MTERVSPFDHPLMLGFDDLEERMNQMLKIRGDNYPPYNVVRVSDQHIRIVVAVAGFLVSDLSIQVLDRQLMIRGAKQRDETIDYLHCGISSRKFQRLFLMAEGMYVLGATLKNGLLTIDLERPVTISVPQTVDIQVLE